MHTGKNRHRSCPRSCRAAVLCARRTYSPSQLLQNKQLLKLCKSFSEDGKQPLTLLLTPHKASKQTLLALCERCFELSENGAVGLVAPARASVLKSLLSVNDSLALGFFRHAGRGYTVVRFYRLFSGEFRGARRIAFPQTPRLQRLLKKKNAIISGDKGCLTAINLSFSA